ncbi:MAG: AgmX/PglI C-terminal domain-containing protein [Myxococcaceae bacterium]|nr:AgmX/PglI C-terminal domain-containing protein [Myxococcaceae bacterium]
MPLLRSPLVDSSRLWAGRVVVAAAVLTAMTTTADDRGPDGGVAPAGLPLSSIGGAPPGVPEKAPGRLGSGAGPAAAVSLGAIVARGPLDAALVRRVLRAHLGLLKHCATLHPGTGKLVVGFVITPKGAVSDAKVIRSTFGQADLDACVVDVVRQRVFPTPRDGGVVDVEVPLEFAKS